MQLNKDLEQNILDIYKKWLEAYLNGDVETYDSFLDVDYHFIGSAAKEEFLNRKDTTQFFADTGEQFAGKTEIRNDSKTVEQFGELFFITHVLDAWFLNDGEWNFYSRFRFTSVLRKNEEGWRFIYQHFSIPDPKTAEGETIGYDKINEENQELREAIQRRTYELEEKNRELEVEGALERIRAQAVAMKASEDLLDIVVTMRKEFIKLGHEAQYFWHMMWGNETYEKAMTSGDGSRIGFVMTLPRHIHGDIPLLAKWEKSKKPTVVYAMNVEEAIDYVDKMVNLGDFKNIDPQAPSHDDIRHIGGLTFIMARTTHGEIGYSLPGVVKNPPQQDLDILVQFAGAFDLAHQRFLDLQKAEQQAREVEIELALEKLRSRTMAMQKSEELSEVSFLLDNLVRELGINTWGCAFNIYGEGESKEWFGNEKGELTTYTVPRTGIFKEYYNKGQEGETLLIKQFSGDDCVTHYEFMSTLPGIGEVLKQLKKTNKGFPTFQIDHVVYFKYGYLLFITRESVPEANDIFKRFAKVFEQTYTRFLDLQKAEAQAREAQIELSLERVRARAMAMQSTNELSDLVSNLLHELTKLDFSLTFCIINIVNEGDMSNMVWAANPEEGKAPESYYMRFEDYPFHHAMMREWKAQTPKFIYVMEGEEKKIYDDYLYTDTEFRRFPKEVQTANRALDKYVSSFVFSKFGGLQTVGDQHLSDESLDILYRFGKVFDLTYTRFNDLQKAEEQAREAKVEAALERIRSRSLAMTKSEQLGDVILEIHKKFRELDISMESRIAIVVVLDSDSKDFNQYIASNDVGNIYISTPYFEHPILDDFYTAKEAGVEFFSKSYTEEEKNSYFKHFFDTSFTPNEIVGLEEQAQWVFDQKFYTHSQAFQKNSCIGMADYSGIPLNDFEIDTIKRFSKVFDQAYTRFLDLQKAEAQTREAHIEAALEKVRSRSLAVHNSEEFKEVVSIVFEKLKELQIPATAVGIGVRIQGSKDLKSYVCGENEAGLVITDYRLPYFNNKISKDLCNAFDKESNLFKGHYSKKVKDAFYKYILDKTSEFKDLPEDVLSMIFNSQSYTITMVTSDQVVFNINDFEGNDLTEHEIDILKRFSRVFNQAFIRFLDLQKAEAQARESQINLAVERVRARALAMHKSEEIIEVVAKLKDEVMGLEIPKIVAATIFLEAENNAIRMWDLSSLERTDQGYLAITDITFKLKKNDPHLYIKRVWENPEDYFVDIQNSKDLDRIIEFMYENNQHEIAKEVEDYTKATNLTTLYHASKRLNNGKLCIDLLDPPPEEMQTILSKMGAAFDLAYKRFEDIKKAEAQAREAQIEAALEKIRSRSLAMHKPEELQEVVAVVAEKLKELGVIYDAGGVILCTYFPDSKDVVHWITVDDFSSSGRYFLPYFDNPIFNDAWDSKTKGDAYFSQEFTVEAKNAFFKHAFENSDYSQMPEDYKQFVLKADQHHLSAAWSKNSAIIIPSLTGVVPSESDADILKRFARVFEQAYIRFLDLEKAEAQAREVQVEMSLEKVRSRTMAMQASSELPEAANTLFLEVQALGIPAWSAGYCIWNADKSLANCNMSSEGEIQKGFMLPTIGEGYDFETPLKKGEKFHVASLGGKELVKHYEFMKTLPGVGEILSELVNSGLELPTFQIFHICYFKHGYVMFITYEPVPNAHDIFKRFSGVFEQTYTRFLDLEKAEAQTREAQIEAALERVRSQSMSMQRSEELSATTQVFHQQLQMLGIDSEFSYLWLPEEDEQHQVFWATWSQNSNNDSDYHTKQVRYPLDKSEPSIAACYTAWESKEPVHVNAVKPEEVEDYFNTWSELLSGVDKFQPQLFQDGLNYIDAYMNYGCFGIMIKRLLNDSEKNILHRFSNEFQRTYTRFLDLQKAEAQARESQIEAALERVRSHSMGMQSTADFAEVTTEMFTQLRNFGEDLFATGIVFCDKHEGHVEQWHSIPGGGMLSPMIVPIDLDYIHQYRYDQWKAGKELFSIEIPSDFIQQHFEDIFKLPSAQITLEDLESRNAPMPEPPPWEIDYGASFKHGYILISSLKHLENTDILPRFAKVFEQAYTRFLDLQTAEKNAYKSKVETALERVRARAMAMQEPDELKEVASVLRTEMGVLGIEELETCSIYILNDDVSNAECWYALKDGRSEYGKLISDHISMDFTKTWVGQQMLKFHDTEQETTSIAMKGEQRIEWIQYCAEQSTILKSYFGDEIPERTYHLQKFSNGAIGAASAGDISEESWALLQRSASVFSLAYSRFKDLTQAKIDLKHLKTEKKRAEDALSELQTTQKQLIQSEKMASLGELTAGIAHEIQNPLNFVNNFSEVSKELLEEMQEEIDNGDFEEVKAIMQDVIQNLEKINHHGRRADGIVKGMLQHSRAGNDKKEATDINALADEYLRLAYHGLRAKDKSFNAKLVTDFDNTIKPIKVVPQDIGRVILNLLTNAFYIVHQKKQTADKAYKPTVIICTRLHKQHIEIKVIDNGNGIPDHIKDKIFQPFFTTKPTGDGTGLGLSLSYDIITKGHGGKLEVNTKTKQGTEFSIQLPL